MLSRGRSGIITLAVLAVLGAGAGAGAAAGAGHPSVSTDRGCYLVGQRVHLHGSGFAPSRMYDVTIDGVDFGQATTNSQGAFSTSLLPGGLAAGVAQSVDQLQASDGSVSAGSTFTLTRSPGARFLATRGNPNTLRTRFEVWGFALAGKSRSVFIHYVSPSGSVPSTGVLGKTGGKCGYLLTRKRRVFPFTPSRGTWTLQVDTRQRYARHPRGPVARIRVVIS